MIDPQQVAETLEVAVTTGHPPVKAIPTVVPTPPEYQLASDTGFKALWVVFAVMLLTSAAFAALSWTVPVSRRLYHVITTLIVVVAALSYFAMATGHGTALHCVEARQRHHHVPDTHFEVCREVYWARYVDWSITTPLLLLDLCLLAGIDGAHTLMAIAADLIMILTGLFAAFGREHTGQRWGWYAIACVSYLVVIWHVALHGTRAVRVKSAPVVRLFSALAVFTLLLWTAYPIVWGVADGARKTSVDSEIIAYAVLDILAKPVFGLTLLLNHHRVPETNIELDGYWSHGLSAGEGAIRIGDNDV